MPGKHTLGRLTTFRKPSPCAPAAQAPACAGPPHRPTPSADAQADALLTPAEAAGKLAVTERVLERWRGTGEGPAFVKLSRKTVRYRAADIGAFVAGSLRSNTVG